MLQLRLLKIYLRISQIYTVLVGKTFLIILQVITAQMLKSTLLLESTEICLLPQMTVLI